MILNNIADCPGLVIKFATPFCTEILRDCDLHTFDVIAIPDRLKIGICKTKKDQIGNRFLPEVVIDAENLGLSKCRV